MARKLDKMKGDGAPATVATESHSQPHTEARAQFHTFRCWVSDTGPRSPAPGPHSPRCTHSHTWGSPHSQGQGHRLKTTPHILPPEIAHIPPPPAEAPTVSHHPTQPSLWHVVTHTHTHTHTHRVPHTHTLWLCFCVLSELMRKVPVPCG